PQGIDRLGGADFDEAVYTVVSQALEGQLSNITPASAAERSALLRLREECRLAKEALSSDTATTLPVLLPGLTTEVRLTRAEFEDAIRPRIRETLNVLDRAVSTTGLEMDDESRILLVGGSSRIPLVAEEVSR